MPGYQVMQTPAQSFVAFFSYVRRNDEHDKGSLTTFRKLLEAELWAQTGKDFQIFQDIEDIEWGDAWKDKITKVLDASTFLIVIVTPGYLESQSCRFEFEYFLKRESLSKRKDSILPILYIDTDGLKNPNDVIAVEISKRQWVDWRELRRVSFDSVKVSRKIELLAKRIRHALTMNESTFVDSTKEISFPHSLTTEKGWDAAWQPNFAQTQISTKPIPGKTQGQSEEASKILLLLEPTGDVERDRRRIKTIYGMLISFHGRDRFSFQVSKGGKPEVIEFPNDTTRIGPELLDRLRKLLGKESWRVEGLTSNNNVRPDNDFPF